MGRIITIPTNCNPYIVVINNHVYVYKAGETVEVPDEVAEAIEDAIELEPKPKRHLGKLAQLAEGSLMEITPNDLEGITAIYNFAFYNCDRFQSVVIADSVKSIGYSAFRFCGSLKSVEIPKGVLNIDERAFDNCLSLTRVKVKAVTPPIIQSETFANIPASCVVEVPSEALGAYKSAAYWSTFANRIVAIKE